MGKINQSQQQQQIQEGGSNASSSSLEVWCERWCWRGVLRARDLFSFKCFFIVILSVALFFSTIYWLPPFYRIRSGYDDSIEHRLNVTVKASFKLQVPVSVLVDHIEELEEDILGEIGMPNTKIPILSIHQLHGSNWSEVIFAVLPQPKDVPINSVSLSILKSSLIELFLHRLNLSLTTPALGQPSDFQILKFAGGITVIPIQYTSIWHMPQILFNFTLNNSISQMQAYFDQLKDQLKYGLQLRSYEMLYIQLTNRNGSTVDPPVVVQASVLSDVGSSNLLPQRLKQLAQTITGSSPAKNLGLDHSVFGKVKEITLSSVLNRTLCKYPNSPSPSPTLPPSQSPSPNLAPSPSEENYYSAPSIAPYAAPSPYAPPSDAPVPASRSPAPLSPVSKSPKSAVTTTHPPRRSKCRGSAVLPRSAPMAPLDPSAPELSPRAANPYPSLGPIWSPEFAPSPSFDHGTSLSNNRRSRKVLVSPLVASSPRLSSPSCFGAGPSCAAMKLLGLMWPPLFYHLFCGLFR